MANTFFGNIAFIDGQNLHMGTAKREVDPWEISLARFRVYLERKYKVSTAYYFLGFFRETNSELYADIQGAGFVLIFRAHNSVMAGNKKGNVDSDIIFRVMRMMYKNEPFRKIVLVSGDGDYKLLVDFLIEENRFEKILFPNKKRASSLYKELSAEHFGDLDSVELRKKIGVKTKKGVLR